jgi:fumarate hydratase subunit beta
MRYHFDLPLKTEDIQKLKLGDIFYVSGLLFTARDKAHKIMKNLLPPKFMLFLS